MIYLICLLFDFRFSGVTAAGLSAECLSFAMPPVDYEKLYADCRYYYYSDVQFDDAVHVVANFVVFSCF